MIFLSSQGIKPTISCKIIRYLQVCPLSLISLVNIYYLDKIGI